MFLSMIKTKKMQTAYDINLTSEPMYRTIFDFVLTRLQLSSMKFTFLIAFMFCLGYSVSAQTDTLHYPEENHFKNIRQLTFGGDNAEAYWSFDGKSIVFQRASLKNNIPCDQIFVGVIPKKGEPFEYKMVSTGKGRTTCAYFTRDNKHVIYASTHEGADSCPPPVDRSKYGNS